MWLQQGSKYTLPSLNPSSSFQSNQYQFLKLQHFFTDTNTHYQTLIMWGVSYWVRLPQIPRIPRPLHSNLNHNVLTNPPPLLTGLPPNQQPLLARYAPRPTNPLDLHRPATLSLHVTLPIHRLHQRRRGAIPQTALHRGFLRHDDFPRCLVPKRTLA